ncbi:hypothetical protein [Pseudobutyrivibrio sp.]
MKKKVIAVLCATMTLSLLGCNNASTSTSKVNEEVVSVPEEDVPESLLDSDTKYVFGTATLTYAEFYSGDVSSTESYDGVSSATTNKYEIFPNMDTDYVDEIKNANGYHINGIKNVNVAVPADEVDVYKGINSTFEKSENQNPAQYKVVKIEGDKATYSKTNLNIVDTVKGATAEFMTGTVWGDYQIDIIENSTSYLKNTREDGDFAIDSGVQGVILETESGLKVGMEYLQSVWVQPYEISFNISADNTHNTHVSYDNLTELDKLENQVIKYVTFINQNDTYVYEFDGIYVKPVFRDADVTAEIRESEETALIANIPEGLENAAVTVTYIVGEGREAVRTVVYEGVLDESLTLDGAALKEGKQSGQEGSYTVVISSDNYANIAAKVK